MINRYLLCVLAPLIMVIAACCVTIYLAVLHGDESLPGKIEKHGLIRSVNTEKHNHANAMQLSVCASTEPKNSLQLLRNNTQETSISELRLWFYHSASSRFDADWRLTKTANQFQLPKDFRHKKRGDFYITDTQEQWVLPLNIASISRCPM